MSRKKSQMSQAFTFIMIILLVGLVAIFGYKGISKIMGMGCDQQSISFEKNLLGYIDSYSDRGTVHEEILATPCGAKKVCFVDSKFYEEQASMIPTLIDDSVIKSNVESKTNNIFIESEFMEPMGFSDKISLENGEFVCFNIVGGELKLIFRGQGRKTLIVQT